MPGGTFAGPYNSSTWVDPNDPTILGANALGADLVDSPVTISFWLKINQVDQPFVNTAPSICAFGRWMYQPHHNAGNNRGISVSSGIGISISVSSSISVMYVITIIIINNTVVILIIIKMVITMISLSVRYTRGTLGLCGR